MLSRITAFFMSIVMFLFPTVNYPKADIDKSEWKTNYTNVFVHGLGGWGSYDLANDLMPYWGMGGGDLIDYLNARGFNCAAASVNPNSSSWDRACELYAQITGTRVDYGKEHSERNNHKRFGKDYTGRALIDKFDSTNKINLLGHSFGGATILMFLDILEDGSEAERAVTPENELSPFFEGGKGDCVYSITALAAPMNGTTALEVAEQVRNDPNATLRENAVVWLLTELSFPERGQDPKDTAGYDMYIDSAAKMLESIETQPEVYYFSLPCRATENIGGKEVPKEELIEFIYAPACGRMCNYTGCTAGGYYIDESWQANDSLVNVKSATAPFNAPQKAIDIDSIEPGIWNVYPAYEGDHMSLMGDMTKVNNVRELYVDMLCRINSVG